jgi:hypothetical protein
MTTVAIAPTGTASFPDGGGHWWVYLQYALGLRDLGCRVLWLERLTTLDGLQRATTILDRFGLDPDHRLFYVDPGVAATSDGATGAATIDAGLGDRGPTTGVGWIGGDARQAEAALAGADALLNFDYSAPATVVDLARLSALVDIDPGLTQTWWADGLIAPADHDRWITTGETVGTDRARFDDCGVEWHHVRPCVHLPSWPRSDGPDDGPWTTVTSWWGDEWLTDREGRVVENNKRVGFLPYADLPARSGARLELAAYFGGAGGAAEVRPDNTDGDGDDVRAFLAGGWRLRRSADVAGDPDRYRSYIAGSRGEFSCVKPSCRLLANAWVSDRTLCYLASGRPAVVEHTGPSDPLDGGEGLLRFHSPDEAVDALARVEADYDRHRRAARDLAEAHFSATTILADLLDELLGAETAARSAARAAAGARR